MSIFDLPGAGVAGSNTTGQVALVSGTKAITITGLTTSSRAWAQLVTPGGTLAQEYKAVCTANTLTLTALTSAGATQTLDTSTVNYGVQF